MLGALTRLGPAPQPQRYIAERGIKWMHMQIVDKISTLSLVFMQLLGQKDSWGRKKTGPK